MVHQGPYTNLHDLNIDWILQVIKEFNEKYHGIDDAINAAIARLNATADELESALSEYATQLEEEATEAVNEARDGALAAINEIYGRFQTEANEAIQSIISNKEVAIAAIDSEMNGKLAQVSTLLNSLPHDYQDALNSMQIINATLNGTNNYPELVQGHYADAQESDSKTLVPDNYRVSSLLSAGCASRKLRTRITNANGIIRDIIYWTGWGDSAVSHPVPVSTSTTDEKTLFTYTFPANATYFTVVFASDYNMLNTIAPADLQVNFQWIFNSLQTLEVDDETDISGNADGFILSKDGDVLSSYTTGTEKSHVDVGHATGTIRHYFKDTTARDSATELYNEINNDTDIPSSINWYVGAFYPSTGGDNNTPTNRIRSGWATLTNDIVGLKPASGYKYAIYAWTSTQTYLGVWNGTTWSKSGGMFFTEPFSLSNFDKTNKYKFVLGRTDDAAMTTEESINLQYVSSKFVGVKNDIENLEIVDAQIDEKINQYMHKYTFNVDSAWTTPFIVENGETVHLTITAVTGSINVFTLGYQTTVYLQITSAGEYTFTVTNTGAIRFYMTGTSAISGLIWIDSRIDSLSAITEYHVGAGKEFTTFNGMLTALANDEREKIVYIDPGEYDIFAEYGGAEYMASIASTAAQMNWRDVCKVVPQNTHIIGLGNVTLKWLATAEQMQNSAVATLFSPLNLSGNCTVENIKVVGQNCRYAVHDETSGLAIYDGAVHHFKNCYFECLQSTYNATTPYGSGHNKNMTLIFDDCEFVNYQNNAWATHHQAATAIEKSTIIFNHCIFRRSRTGSDFYVQFTTDKANGLKDEVRFNGCYISAKIKFYTESASSVQQGYDVTLINSSQVEIVYSANITTRYEVRQLNAIT